MQQTRQIAYTYIIYVILKTISRTCTFVSFSFEKKDKSPIVKITLTKSLVNTKNLRLDSNKDIEIKLRNKVYFYSTKLLFIS